jgi:hypothetical protein
MASLPLQRALVIAPRFFGYDREIVQELIRRGVETDFLPDRPFDTPLMTALTRVLRRVVVTAADRLYLNALETLGRSGYDVVLIVNGQTVSRRILLEMRRAFPGATFILYMWDSLRNRRSVRENLSMFDRCFTFDPLDARYFAITPRPLFFSPGYERASAPDPRFDLSFVGTAHTDRYAIISSIRSSLPSHVSAYWYLYLQAPWVFWWYKASLPAFASARIDDFRFAALPGSQVQQIFADSRTILDIEHPNQTGLTMRTFEAMGGSKKLITTNARVRDYDFFDERNIFVVDRACARVSPSFLSTEYRALPPAIYARYRISGWMNELLGAPHDEAAALVS